MSDLASLYANHLATICRHADAALAAAHCDTLAIAAGRPLPKFQDDQDFAYVAHPCFKYWLPVTHAPGSWLLYTPGKKPRVLYMQPRDYWHAVPEAPSGYWVDHVDVVPVHSIEDLAAELPTDATRCAIIGQPQDAVGAFVPNNPEPTLNHLAYHRAWKTPYEQELMREANRIGTRAHRAARDAFNAGQSEFGIHMAFLAAAVLTEPELPYGSIVALNEHGATLHYQEFDRTAPAQHRSLLIDAGATHAGYASDITRTYASPAAGEFQALIDGMEANQKQLRERVVPGQDYRELHLEAHRLVAELLIAQDFLHMSADEAVASHVTSTFFPHGLGHLIGANVHDVAGFQASPEGGRIEQPEGHPFLRLTRTLSPGMITTIEPGVYFSPMLLDELKAKPEGKHVNWAKVDHFRQYGGIRIEDNVLCTNGAPENLTRDAFAAQPRT
ncbi:MAG TPA: Xaa-Pro dipeptidase [Rhodanobacteraceae bacterium]